MATGEISVSVMGVDQVVPRETVSHDSADLVREATAPVKDGRAATAAAADTPAVRAAIEIEAAVANAADRRWTDFQIQHVQFN